MPLRPHLTQAATTFTIDGAEHTVDAWSDVTALEVARLAVGRGELPSRCESGICGTCEVLVDAVPTRLCSIPGRRIAGRTSTRISTTSMPHTNDHEGKPQ